MLCESSLRPHVMKDFDKDVKCGLVNIAHFLVLRGLRPDSGRQELKPRPGRGRIMGFRCNARGWPVAGPAWAVQFTGAGKPDELRWFALKRNHLR